MFGSVLFSDARVIGSATLQNRGERERKEIGRGGTENTLKSFCRRKTNRSYPCLKTTYQTFQGRKNRPPRLKLKRVSSPTYKFFRGVTLKFAYHRSESFSEKSGGCYFLENELTQAASRIPDLSE